MNRKLLAVITSLVIIFCGGIAWYENDNSAARGEHDFQRLGCGGCHYTGAGPNLTHVVGRQDPKFLERFIANPPEIYRERKMRPINPGYMLMPDMHASAADAREIVAYLRELDKQDK